MEPTISISEFVKQRRKKLGMTQAELSQKAGVGLRFVRELEQKKEALKADKINQVLALFGHTLGPVPKPKSKDDEQVS